MSSDSEVVAALRRAGRRAAVHLLRAAIEALRAFEVLVEELARIGADGEDLSDEPGLRQQIDVE